MKKSILISALLLCIAPSVFGQQKTAYQTRKIAEKDKKQQYKNKVQKENSVREEAQDIPHIKNDIKNEFLRWAKKGEFESSKEHFERIQSERAKKLHQVITDCFARRMYDDRMDDNRIIKIELGTYNADKKIYPISIINRHKISVKNNIPFERKEAIEFKEAIEKEEYTGQLHYRFSEEDPDNWFVKDGFLFPINVEYNANYDLEYTVGGEKLKKISDKGNYPLFSEYVFNTDDLGLSEYFPENYTFTLKSLKIRKEK